MMEIAEKIAEKVIEEGMNAKNLELEEWEDMIMEQVGSQQFRAAFVEPVINEVRGQLEMKKKRKAEELALEQLRERGHKPAELYIEKEGGVYKINIWNSERQQFFAKVDIDLEAADVYRLMDAESNRD